MPASAVPIQIQEKLSKDLLPSIKAIIPALGVKDLDSTKLEQIAQEVADETARQTVEDVAKIQSPSQAVVVVADSLTQTLVTHPQLENKISLPEEKIFAKALRDTQGITLANQSYLEKAAVLGNLAAISTFKKPNQQILETIERSAQSTIEAEAPLTNLQTHQVLKTSLSTYLSAYNQELEKQLAILGKGNKMPTFDQIQKAKEAAHNLASGTTGSSLQKTTPGKEIADKIGYQKATGNLAVSLGLTPPKTSLPPSPVSPYIAAHEAPKMPLVGSIILSNPTHVTQAYLALLAFDQEKLAKGLRETTAEIKSLQGKPPLSFKERKTLRDAYNRYNIYASAKAFATNKTKKAHAFSTLFSQAYGRPDLASQKIWETQFRQNFTYSPKILQSNERLAAGAAFGSLGFHLGNSKDNGSIFALIRGQITGAKSSA